jgi:hypothetical protein
MLAVLACLTTLFFSCSQAAQEGLELSSEVDISSAGTYEDFLNAILIRESTIDPAQSAYYTKNFNVPNAQEYPKVDYPGRVVRDNNGDPVDAEFSIKEYFAAINVLQFFHPGDTDINDFHKMQGATTNYLGFIGFQFSEQDAHVLGYYNYALDSNNYPIYYVDVPNSTWANGVRDKIMLFPDSGWVHVTDVNKWGGKFTGKDGIDSIKDFMDYDKQFIVAKAHFEFKHDNLVKFLAAQGGQDISYYIGKVYRYSECVPPITPPPTGDAVTITMSGLLAGAHLRGAQGDVNLLLKHICGADEAGTSILAYLHEFAGYDTPWGQ